MPTYKQKQEFEGLTIAVYGLQERLRALGKSAIIQAANLGADRTKVCRIITPSNQTDDGYQTLQAPRFDTFMQCEGTWLDESRSAAMLQTADCPTIVLFNRETGRVVITHAGRPAMTPPAGCDACLATIATQAVRSALQGSSAEHVSAWILAGICGHCFVHDQPGAETFIQPFDRFGPTVFTDRSRGALDLKRVIALQLMGYGVAPERIAYDDVCTFEHSALASYRRNTPAERRNTIMVVKH